MRLIGPDSEDSSEQGTCGGPNHQDSPLSRLPRKTLSELSLMKSRSRENIAGSGIDLQVEESAGSGSSSSYHMARPATVISGSSLASSASSPGVELRGSSPHVSSVSIGASAAATTRSGRNSGGPLATSPVVVVATAATSTTGGGGRYGKEATTGNNSLLLPLTAAGDTVTQVVGGGPNNINNNTKADHSNDMDWSSLVDTATKAILSSAGEEESSEGGGGSEPAVNRRPRSVVAGGEEEEEVRRLLQRVSSLEAELAGERRGREQLGRQVDQLREENVRLQEESQTAAQQLRRFTEWFFQTIDKS